LWKEWREQRWIAVLLVSVLVAILLLGLMWGVASAIGAVTIALFAMPAVGMFLAMHIAAREQSAGTIQFLQALPATGAKPAAAKLLLACAAITAPIAAVVALAAVVAWQVDLKAIEEGIGWPNFGTTRGLVGWYATTLLAPSLSLLIWMAAIGVNRSDEVRAGAIGFLGISGVWLVLGSIGYLCEQIYGNNAPMPLWLGVLLAAAPGGIAASIAETSEFTLMILAALVSHAALAGWYIARFGRVAAGKSHEIPALAAAAKPQQDCSWLAPPRCSPLAAIVWKQTRESAPLAALGAGSIVALSLAIAWIARNSEDGQSPSSFGELVYGIWMIVGFGVSIVAGIGVFMDDVQPGISGFWRSRPINVDQWFAVKYLSGLVVTLFSLAAGALVLWAGMAMIHGRDAFLPNARGWSAAVMFGVGLLVQFGLFSAATAGMTLLRQPIYAAVTAIAAAMLALMGTIITVEWLAGWQAFPDWILYAVNAVGALVAVVLSWQAVRNDWGWKR
jgi:ABC-type transport system involved in multi-copper enzyme maturation permease subunit